MSVSAELLCSFELLKPLDSSALKSHIKKSRNKRQSMLNSPVRPNIHRASRTSHFICIYIFRILTNYGHLQPANQHPQSY